MADYSMIRRGVLTASATDTSPKTATITAVKLGSASLRATVRENRNNKKLQSGSLALTDADTSPKDVTITAVDLTRAKAMMTFRQLRTNGHDGITVKFLNATTLRFQFGVIDTGDTINAEWMVEEEKTPRSATMRLLNATTVELSWDGGALATGETIVAAYDVEDFNDVGNDFKEVLFRLSRVLGYLGENTRQDLITYDDPGNMILYRLRIFDTKAHAESSTINLPDGEDLENGELARVRMTQAILASQNDRTGMIRVLTDLLATPGVN